MPFETPYESPLSGRVAIRVIAGRAQVCRSVAYDPYTWDLTRAANWRELERRALSEVWEQAGGRAAPGWYDCSPELAKLAVWHSSRKP